MIENPTSEKLKTITINRTVNLPLNTVWKSWTEPESCRKWWGPEEFTCPACNIDFKVGGKYLTAMKGPDGKETWSTGTFKEIITNKKIVFTDSFADSKGNIVPASYYNMPGEWPISLLVNVEFVEANGKTMMHLQQSGLPPEMADDCVKGWQSMFDKMERVFK